MVKGGSDTATSRCKIDEIHRRSVDRVFLPLHCFNRWAPINTADSNQNYSLAGAIISKKIEKKQKTVEGHFIWSGDIQTIRN